MTTMQVMPGKQFVCEGYGFDGLFSKENQPIIVIVLVRNSVSHCNGAYAFAVLDRSTRLINDSPGPIGSDQNDQRPSP